MSASELQRERGGGKTNAGWNGGGLASVLQTSLEILASTSQGKKADRRRSETYMGSRALVSQALRWMRLSPVTMDDMTESREGWWLRRIKSVDSRPRVCPDHPGSTGPGALFRSTTTIL